MSHSDVLGKKYCENNAALIIKLSLNYCHGYVLKITILNFQLNIFDLLFKLQWCHSVSILQLTLKAIQTHSSRFSTLVLLAFESYYLDIFYSLVYVFSYIIFLEANGKKLEKMR